MNRSQAYVRASKFYLTEELPEDILDLPSEEQDEFVEDHRWQPFECWSVHDVWELIDDLARDMLKIHELATLATPEPEPKPDPKPDPECCEHCNLFDVFSKGLCQGCFEDQYSDGARW